MYNSLVYNEKKRNFSHKEDKGKVYAHFPHRTLFLVNKDILKIVGSSHKRQEDRVYEKLEVNFMPYEAINHTTM